GFGEGHAEGLHPVAGELLRESRFDLIVFRVEHLVLLELGAQLDLHEGLGEGRAADQGPGADRVAV
ncbi:MAG: hypothetical protein ACK559_01815, partial [bacterium]